MEQDRQQNQQRGFAAPPVADSGLYSFANEHNACGVGLVADLNNQPSHRIVEMGLTVLKRLMHRGASGGDPNTGDGAGLLLALPHEFFRREMGPDGSRYYTDLEQAQTLNESAVNSRLLLIRFEFELKIAAELTGVASSDPCVTAGESAGLLFSVENKGNLPISRFGVTIKQGSKVVQQILVDCQNPQREQPVCLQRPRLFRHPAGKRL